MYDLYEIAKWIIIVGLFIHVVLTFAVRISSMHDTPLYENKKICLFVHGLYDDNF